MTRQLDQLDNAMIDILQTLPRATFKEIANRTGASATTVSRRLNRLLETGVVVIRAVHNQAEEPRQHVILEIDSEVGRVREVANNLAQHPSIHWVGLVSGGWPILVRTMLPAQSSVVDFIMNDVAVISGVRDVRALPVLEVVKGVDQFASPPRLLPNYQTGHAAD